MKTFRYILIVSAMLSFTSCFEDESTYATSPISEISIDESSIERVYNIDKNDTLRIIPQITQKNEELPLSYQWELNQEVVSTDKVFCYVGKDLGVFNARLIVENEDGKAFFIFTLNVNSPYEYGVTILSKDTDNRPHIAFMQEPMTEGAEAKFYEENCLEKNNPEQFFASNPSDIVHTKGSLIVACQGDDTKADDAPAIYFLNEKTFVVENLIVVNEYEGFKPTKLLIPFYNSSGLSYPVLSADGKMYSLPTSSDAVLQPSAQFTSTYAQTAFVRGVNAGNYDINVWDKDINGLAVLYNNYGPYYCGKTYLLNRDSVAKDTYFEKNFSKLKGIRTLTYINKTPSQLNTGHSEMIAIVEASLRLQKAIIGTFFWRRIEGAIDEYEVLDNGKEFSTKAASKSYSLINENTPCIANATYETMLFPNGNKVLRWYYNKANHDLEDADELLTVGSDDAIITSFEISEDHTKTYVAFYEPDQEGKNGSVWVFETNTGKVLEQYDNVCYQPVKMIYKKK